MLMLVGKTCSGKTTIAKELKKLGFKEAISYTTRPPREHETEGVEYHFITKEEFLKKEAEGFFAETVYYDVATGERWYYGSAVEDLADDKIIIVNRNGLKKIKNFRSLNPVAFYITASEETIWNRLRQRGDDAAEARRRLNADDTDFLGIEKYVDFSFSNDLGLKPDTVAEMIKYTYDKTMEVIS